MASLKKIDETVNTLKTYNGNNPYILMLKKQVFVNKDLNAIGDFQIEYIKNNINSEPKPIGRMTKLAGWYAEKKQNDWKTDFLPEKVKIVSLLGETSTTYHCYVKYRQSIPPVMCFIPKKAVLKNFLLDDYHNYQVDFNRYDRISMEKDKSRKLFEHQKDGVRFLLSRKKCILADEMGSGKLEPLSNILPTPNGYKKMGDINVGDYVFGEDGNPHKVTKIFDHLNKDIYKVTFSDNTYAYCGLDHLWSVRDCNMRIRNKGWKTLSLKELLRKGFQYNTKYVKKDGSKVSRNKWEIPICNAVDYKKIEYFIDPYLLGVMIGDGNMCNKGIHISIPDTEIETANRITKILKNGYKLSVDRSSSCPRYSIIKDMANLKRFNEYNTEIKKLGLNVKGKDKFIPYEYLIGSIDDRLKLLRGLMDTDGSISKEKNHITYSTISEKLADDICELVCSLGGTARKHMSDRRKHGKNIEYTVLIQIKQNPFCLKRKKEKYNPTNKKYCHRYIVSAVLDRKEDARCIMVDYEKHTYLTGKRYIVTHNTTTLSVAAIEGNFDSVVIICPASLKTNWAKELKWYVPSKDITILESLNNKTKSELETFLSYREGASGKKKDELLEEAKEKGKWESNRFVILNYDILDEFYKLPTSRSKENTNISFRESPLLRYIYNRKSLLIIDEAHRLSNSTSGRYKIIKSLIRQGNPDSIYLATGTPITNNPQNLYCLLNLLDDPITSDWNYYMNRYCDAKEIVSPKDKEKRNEISKNYIASRGKSNWWALTDEEKSELQAKIKRSCKMMTIAQGASNLDELKDRISHIYLRRTKEDFTNLPQKIIHEVHYQLTPSQQIEYNRLWDEYEEAKREENPDAELNKDLLEGGIYRRYLSNIVVPHTEKLADRLIEKGEKVVIACCFDEELYTLKEYYGDKCVIYNGKMNSKQKDAAVYSFMKDPSIMVFIGNIIAAGVGLTLISSHTLIFNDMSFVPSDNFQMEDRVHRIGQTKQCDIYYQIFDNTQYEHMWDIVIRKAFTIDQVIKKETEK
jgi:hypothetical protein